MTQGELTVLIVVLAAIAALGFFLFHFGKSKIEELKKYFEGLVNSLDLGILLDRWKARLQKEVDEAENTLASAKSDEDDAKARREKAEEAVQKAKDKLNETDVCRFPCEKKSEAEAPPESEAEENETAEEGKKE